MLYGVSYYPEQKEAEELEQDLKLLIESGINTVRMGEFSWCRMEPSEGVYRFDWLDEVIDRLGKSGIKTVVCTPTACPPAWMIQKYPDILYMDNRGIRRPFGGRRHYCYNNEQYRMYSGRIAEKIGEHYGKNPYVIGFQIDNEPAQEGTGRCTCPVCQSKFREWLKNKYKNIGEFNKRSASIFWSQEYEGFDQICIPVNSIEEKAQQLIDVFYENPTIRLEFERFASDSQIEYQNVQTDALKKYTDYIITTNTTGLATNSINYYQSTEKLDNYAFDYYPRLRDAKISSFAYAFARGIKKDVPFWILEFMAGGGHCLGGVGRIQPNPGTLKQAAVHSMACGAEMMLHFQFRTFPGGAEQLNYSIVDMDGVPRRRYYEMKETAELLKEIEPVFESKFNNEVAICFDYDTHWALKIKPINKPEFEYVKYCEKFYQHLHSIGINADVISYKADFSSYKVVFIPTGFVFSEDMREKCKEYVSVGGTLFSTFLTGVKNEDNIGYTETLPAGLNELFGITVEEIEPVISDTHTKLKLKVEGEQICMDGIWSELLKGSGKALGIYIEGYKENQIVISENQFGKGKAYYMGTDLPEKEMETLLAYICDNCSINRNPFKLEGRAHGFEIVHRFLNDKIIYFVFNFTSDETNLKIEAPLIDYLTKEIQSKAVEVPKGKFKIFIET